MSSNGRPLGVFTDETKRINIPGLNIIATIEIINKDNIMEKVEEYCNKVKEEQKEQKRKK